MAQYLYILYKENQFRTHKNGKSNFMQSRPYVQRAIPDVFSLFEDKYNRPLRKPYYMRQLQVKFENKYFPWVITNALSQLVDQGSLKRFNYVSKNRMKIAFFFNNKLNTPNYMPTMETHIKSASRLIDAYAHPNISRYLGKNLETLVKAEVRAQGFKIVGESANSYNSRTWTETNHNLDFIAEHRSGNLNIGIEVKNTLSLIDKKELTTKLDMCRYLEIRPVFATRWIKPYMYLITKDYSGFSWVFKTQMYPLGLEKLVKEIYNGLGLPVSVRTELPPKSVRLFERWIDANT